MFKPKMLKNKTLQIYVFRNTVKLRLSICLLVLLLFSCSSLSFGRDQYLYLDRYSLGEIVAELAVLHDINKAEWRNSINMGRIVARESFKHPGLIYTATLRPGITDGESARPDVLLIDVFREQSGKLARVASGRFQEEGIQRPALQELLPDEIDLHKEAKILVYRFSPLRAATYPSTRRKSTTVLFRIANTKVEKILKYRQYLEIYIDKKQVKSSVNVQVLPNRYLGFSDIQLNYSLYKVGKSGDALFQTKHKHYRWTGAVYSELSK